MPEQPSAPVSALELVPFTEGATTVHFGFDGLGGEVWATQAQIAALFEREVGTISHHLKNIFDDGELDPAATLRKFRTVRSEGGRAVSRDVEHYSLDAILSVGYRVSSKRATAFRQWATRTLRSYLENGYALNERRLREDPNALRELAAKIRELRSGEKQIYAAVRECFKLSATDYDSRSDACKRFYAKLQDKLHYATTTMTSAGIVLDRARSEQPNMGLTSMRGAFPTVSDVIVAKNYLDHDELYILHIISESWLLFAESHALRGKQLTMDQLAEKFDDLLKLGGYPLFKEWKEALRGAADRHAKRELVQYERRLMIESQRREQGLPVDDGDDLYFEEEAPEAI